MNLTAMLFDLRRTNASNWLRTGSAAAIVLLTTPTVLLAQSAATTTPTPSILQTIQTKPPASKVGWIEGILRKDMANGGFSWGSAAHMRIYKEENVVEMWLKKGAKYEKFKDFKICKWSGKLGPKLQEGDEQSPEGVYSVTRKQLLSRTKNHRAVNLDFPNAYDTQNGRTGSYLQIHGGCGSVGCYAMTDRGIEEIYRILDASFEGGQKRVSTHIFPFHLTDEKLTAKRTHKSFDFWSMLKPIYASFMETQTLPGVRVCGTRYVAPGDTANPPEKCVPTWQVPTSSKIKTKAKSRTASSQSRKSIAKRKPVAPKIIVKCNLRLPSCKRWVANQRKKLARRGVRTAGIRQGGESYVRKGSASSSAVTRPGRTVRSIARDRRRRALRQ